jgi:glycosyltransferase involved in cell wall biosynthesis
LKKKIAFFVCHYALGTNPSLVNSIKCLASAGFIVDVFLYNVYDYKYAQLDQNNIHIHILNRWGIVSNGEKSLITGITTRKIIDKLRKITAITNIYQFFMPMIKNIAYLIKLILFKKKECVFIPQKIIYNLNNKFNFNDYTCFIGIDPKGLIFANLINKFSKKIIYYSFELHLTNQPLFENFYSNIEHNILKKLERKYHKMSVATIIQDSERAELLLADNQITNTKVLYVPVSLSGPYINEKTSFFHDELNIPKNKKILLQVGSIHSVRCSYEIAKAAQNLPEEFVVVMHGMISKDYMCKIKNIDTKNKVYISNTLVSLDMIPTLVSSADIGLVFYSDHNLNDFTVALSSSQLAYHMQCGLPVITINFPGFEKIINTYQCGVTISTLDDFNTAVQKIVDNYEFYHQNAYICYNNVYNISKYFKPIVEFIGNI